MREWILTSRSGVATYSNKILNRSGSTFYRGHEEPKAFVRTFLLDYVGSSVRDVPALEHGEVWQE